MKLENGQLLNLPSTNKSILRIPCLPRKRGTFRAALNGVRALHKSFQEPQARIDLTKRPLPGLLSIRFP